MRSHTLPPIFRLALVMALAVWANSLPQLVYSKDFKIPKNSSLAGQIAGLVLDQSGACVGGASVILFGAAGLEAQRSLTDQRGRFTLEKVMAADYVLSVQKNGFRELRRVLHVTPGETLQLEFQLNVASIFETVTVTP